MTRTTDSSEIDGMGRARRKWRSRSFCPMLPGCRCSRTAWWAAPPDVATVHSGLREACPATVEPAVTGIEPSTLDSRQPPEYVDTDSARFALE